MSASDWIAIVAMLAAHATATIVGFWRVAWSLNTRLTRVETKMDLLHRSQRQGRDAFGPELQARL